MEVSSVGSNGAFVLADPPPMVCRRCGRTTAKDAPAGKRTNYLHIQIVGVTRHYCGICLIDFLDKQLPQMITLE